MKLERIVYGLGLLVLLVGCASSPSPRYFMLGEGLADALPHGVTPSIVITQITLPELIDRPQLVVRRSDNHLKIDEFQRWGEPLRRDIPRVLADALGCQLNSSRVLSLPINGQDFDADFRLLFDIQRFDVVEGQGAYADIVWRLFPRQGRPIFGRSVLREESGSSDTEALVAAQRRVLKMVAAEIAPQVRLLMERQP